MLEKSIFRKNFDSLQENEVFPRLHSARIFERYRYHFIVDKTQLNKLP